MSIFDDMDNLGISAELERLRTALARAEEEREALLSNQEGHAAAIREATLDGLRWQEEIATLRADRAALAERVRKKCAQEAVRWDARGIAGKIYKLNLAPLIGEDEPIRCRCGATGPGHEEPKDPKGRWLTGEEVRRVEEALEFVREGLGENDRDDRARPMVDKALAILRGAGGGA